MLVLNYVKAIVGRFNDRWAGRGTGGEGPPAHLVTRAWFNPNLESRWFIVPGIVGLLTLVVTVLVTALSVAREREQGTFDQLLVTSLRPVEILIGKSVPGLVIGVLEATVIILAAVFWFEVPLWGALGTLYTGVVLFLLSAIGIGLMISSLSVTQQQGLLGAFLFLVPAVILSGFMTPIANMPETVQYITLVNPMRYFLVILREVFLEAAPFHALVGQFWPMAVIALATLATAELPDDLKKDMALYTGCIAGASFVQELASMLQRTGFESVRIQPKDESRTFIRDWMPGLNIGDYVASATIEAVKSQA